MKRRRMELSVALFLFLVLMTPQQLMAAPYYEGKVLTIIVGYGPGGGYDRMARVLAKHLSKYIPGNPSVIVQNMPGASSMIAANHLYNTAKPDGLTIGTFNRGLIFAQMTKADGVRFDFTKYAWVGSSGVSTSVLAVRGDLPYKTFDELRKADLTLKFGGSGRADIATQFLYLLMEFTGLKAKAIVYPSSSDIFIAVERKELDGQVSSYDSIGPQIARGLLRPVIRSRIPEPGIENLPVGEDIATDKKGKLFMALHSSIDKVGRPYVAHPATPPEIVNTLREAFRKVADDPELKVDAEKTMMPVRYSPGDECLKIMNDLLSQPPEILKEFGQYVAF